MKIRLNLWRYYYFIIKNKLIFVQCSFIISVICDPINQSECKSTFECTIPMQLNYSVAFHSTIIFFSTKMLQNKTICWYITTSI